MARQPSKILSADELKQHKADLKTEINTHSNAVSVANKLIAGAQKTLKAANAAAEAALAKAQKDHIAALKAASKAFEVVQKAQTKAVEAAIKLGLKAEGKVAALVPPAKAAPKTETAPA